MPKFDMKKIIIALACILSGCTAEDSAVRALKQAGYTDIKIEGYAFFACGEDDTFHTKFIANGPTGVISTGVVCSGIFKGSTIRLD
jgi:hypothetical protein